MTSVRGAVSGTHPLGEPLIQAILDFKYGRSDKENVKELFKSELNSLIQLQENLGFPNVSVGSYGIEDLIRPFTRSLPALKSYESLGDLPINRWHFTNTFFRQPNLVSELPEEGMVILQDQHSLSDETSYSHKFVEGKSAKIILPGPYSFTKLITNDANVYSSEEGLIEGISRYLAAELKVLPDQYVEVQFDEPYFVWERVPRTLRPLIRSAYETLKPALGGKKAIINTYFETSDNILSFLLDLPVNGIGIDFTETNLLSVLEYSLENRALQAGILDSQNYTPDENGSIDTSRNSFYEKVVETLADLYPTEIIVTSTTGLEYFPQLIANQRLEQIASIVGNVKEKLS